MKKNLMALIFALMASNGIANAATKSNTSQVNIDFVLLGQCKVTGNWSTSPLVVTSYDPFDASLGTLTIEFSGNCNGKPYIEGTDKASSGDMLAIGPNGSTVVLVPEPNGRWWRDYKSDLYFYDAVVTPNDVVTVNLKNGQYWNPVAGKYSTILLIGTYSI
ncbi:TPA: CD15/CS22/SEF14 family fimbrial major subunit [Providencia alcalifaciens]